MKNRRNYYRLLHVQPDAPREVIRSSYRALMLSLEMHPDRGGDHWNAALLNEAYAVISDPRRRREYDASRKAVPASPPPERSAGPDRAGPAGATMDCCVFCGRPQPPGAARALRSRCAGCSSPLAMAPRLDLEASGRRAVQRVARRAGLAYYIDWPGKANPGTLEDLSLHGLRFTTGERLALYRILRLESELFAATARVVTVREHGAAGHVVGVEFFTLEISQSGGTFLSVRG